MSISRNDILIKQARQASLNQRYGDTYGVPQSFFVTSLQSANLTLQRYLCLEEIELGSTWIDQDVETDVASNTIATDIFAFNKVYEVHFSADGTSFYELTQMYRRGEEGSGPPSEYYVEGGRIWLDSIPTTGTLRYRYEKRFERLDLRRGTVESYEVVTAPLQIVLAEDTIDTFELADTLPEYVCINDRYGNITARNIPVDSWDSSTRAISIPSSYALPSDEAIAVGSYVTCGPDSTTHAKFNDICEDFLVRYMKLDAYEIHSSEDWAASNPVLDRMLDQIAKVYAALPSSKMPIPETRGEY